MISAEIQGAGGRMSMATTAHNPWIDSTAIALLFAGLFGMVTMMIRLCASMLEILARP
jgi:hypothetical protein